MPCGGERRRAKTEPFKRVGALLILSKKWELFTRCEKEGERKVWLRFHPLKESPDWKKDLLRICYHASPAHFLGDIKKTVSLLYGFFGMCGNLLGNFVDPGGGI